MENRKWSVYLHTFPNGKYYVGITSQKPEERWKNGTGYTKQSHLFNAIKKYGWNNIKHEILYTNLTEEEASLKEQELIKKYDSYHNGYNKTLGGYQGFKYDENTQKEAISLWKDGYTLKQISIKMNIATVTLRNFLYRANIDEEEIKEKNGFITKEKESKIISLYTKDHKFLKEIAQILNLDRHTVSDVLKRNNINPLENQTNNKKVFKKEDVNTVKELLLKGFSSKMIAEKYNCCIKTVIDFIAKELPDLSFLIQQNNIKSRSNPVKQLNLKGEIVNIFPSLREAARILNKDRSTITKACKENKIAYGYKWEFI